MKCKHLDIIVVIDYVIVSLNQAEDLDDISETYVQLWYQAMHHLGNCRGTNKYCLNEIFIQT